MITVRRYIKSADHRDRTGGTCLQATSVYPLESRACRRPLSSTWFHVVAAAAATWRRLAKRENEKRSTAQQFRSSISEGRRQTKSGYVELCAPLYELKAKFQVCQCRD